MKLSVLIKDLQWVMAAEGDIETNIISTDLRVRPGGFKDGSDVYVHATARATGPRY